jgi:hypothetical protein
MKRCPSCNEKYDDDDLNFCLNDGQTLRHYDKGAALWSSSRTGDLGDLVARLMQGLAILSLVVALGSCAGYLMTHEEEFGQEEEYAPGKMGARSYSITPESDKIFGFSCVGGAVIFVVAGFASVVFRTND